MSSQTYTAERLAAWVASLKCEDLSREVVGRVEDCILDSIGCAVSAYRSPGVAAVRAVAIEQYTNGKAPVWFGDTTLVPVGAAFANAAAAAALDIDDGHRFAMGHPGAAVVPTALALAADIDCTGADIIAAIVAGYEVAVRLGAGEIRKSYHTGNWSGFGAAATTAKILGLSVEQMVHAFAVTTYHGPRLRDLTESVDMGAHVKESIPWSVVTGMTAVDLARKGFTGCRDALDVGDRFDPGVVLDGLGVGEPKIGGVYFKQYSSCRWTHTAIEALISIMSRHGLAANDIVAVEVETFEQAAALNNRVDPDTLEGAQYSLPYCLGLAATLGDGVLSPLSVDALNHRPSIDFARKVIVRRAGDMDAYLPARTPSRVVVRTANGRFAETVVDAWGDAGSRTGREELRAKFRRLAAGYMPGALAEETIAAVDDIFRSGSGRLGAALAHPVVRADSKVA